jgi:DNA-binding MarR family transcriptional regulator
MGAVNAHARRPEMPVEVSSRIGYLLSRLGASAREGFSDALAPLGLRPKQYGALALLNKYQPTSQQTLAIGLRVDRSTIVGIVDHLEALGAVARQPDPHDRRRHALHLTPAGRELLGRCDTIARELQERRLAPLTAQQRHELLALLTILARHQLRPGPEAATPDPAVAGDNAGP